MSVGADTIGHYGLDDVREIYSSLILWTKIDDLVKSQNILEVHMLSRKQKEKLKEEWLRCPEDDKQMIMNDFIRLHGDDLGWETWMIFLGERLTPHGCEEFIGYIQSQYS